MIHFARIESSDRLRRLLNFLELRGSNGATTWEIVTECRITSPPTAISELRHNGYDVVATEVGRKVFRYVLQKGRKVPLDPTTPSDKMPTMCMGKPGAEGPGSSVLIVASRDDSPRKSSPCTSSLGLVVPTRYVDPVDTVTKRR
jgi:hypothetical protein